MSHALAERMADLRRRIANLRPNWGNPERFYEDRSEIEVEAKHIEKEMRS